VRAFEGNGHEAVLISGSIGLHPPWRHLLPPEGGSTPEFLSPTSGLNAQMDMRSGRIREYSRGSRRAWHHHEQEAQPTTDTAEPTWRKLPWHLDTTNGCS
jgi:hypothetical protein